jgi:hypothetical protein
MDKTDKSSAHLSTFWWSQVHSRKRNYKSLRCVRNKELCKWLECFAKEKGGFMQYGHMDRNQTLQDFINKSKNFFLFPPFLLPYISCTKGFHYNIPMHPYNAL